jgi:Fe/S biogenesis protein NfuA
MHYTLSDRAIVFLNDLFAEYQQQFSVRLRLESPGTSSAKVAMELESLSQLQADSELLSIPVGTGFIFFNREQEPFVQGLSIGFKSTLTGGELEIDLPALFGDQSAIPLIERIRLFFQKEIQPALDAHRGHAVVKDLTPNNELVIAFAGGCQGCSLASVTLKNLIDDKIREHFPQITKVIDATNHAAGDKPYA